MSDWLALNRANWDERVPAHLAVGAYGKLREGAARLTALEDPEIGDVAGLRILHLQCHTGQDSLALVRRGATVTGIDFSTPALEAARAAAAEFALPARFVLASVDEATTTLPEPGAFDMTYTSWGTICWLPDIRRWAETIAFFLRPGGALYFADAHPMAYVFDDMDAPRPEQRPDWFTPYLGRAPVPYDDPTDYANPDARLANSRQVNWLHPVSDIVNALQTAGLRLEWLHEHPRIAWRMFRSLVRDADGMWTWPDKPWLPLALSLRAVRL